MKSCAEGIRGEEVMASEAGSDGRAAIWWKQIQASALSAKHHWKLCTEYAIGEDTELQIEKDLTRALHGNVIRSDEELNDRLRVMLSDYCRINPAVGYCQGMNTIGASVLLALLKNRAQSEKAPSFSDDEVKHDESASSSSLRKQSFTRARNESNSFLAEDASAEQPSLSERGTLIEQKAFFEALESCKDSFSADEKLERFASAAKLYRDSTAFWIFTAIIEQNRGYYLQNMCGLVVDQRVLTDLMVSWTPMMLQHFHKFEIDVATLTASWFICLFVEAPLKLQDAWKIWDMYMEYGQVVLFETAICLMKLCEKNLDKMKTQEETLIFFLQKLPKVVDLNSIPFDVSVMHDEYGSGLIDQVSNLRDFHQLEVMNSQINGEGYIQLTLSRTASQMGHSFENLSHWWRQFHEPNRWEILESGVIQDPAAFREAIQNLCWSESHIKRKWKHKQALKQVFERLFKVLTKNLQGQMNFIEFVKTVSLLQSEDWKTRLPLAFAFVNIDAGENEAQTAISYLLVLYSGRYDRDEIEKIYRELFASCFEGSPMSSFQIFVENAPKIECIRYFFHLEDSNLFRRLKSRGKTMLERLSR